MSARLGRLTFPVSTDRIARDDRAWLASVTFAFKSLSAILDGVAAHREFLAMTSRGVPKREALDRVIPQPTRSR